MALTKDEVKTIEKHLNLKTILAFLKTLDFIYNTPGLAIPNIRAYAEEKLRDEK